MVPAIINNNPITLPKVNVSFKNKTPIKKTKAGAMLIKGYAIVISNFVIAAIQNSDAKNAEKKPENI